MTMCNALHSSGEICSNNLQYNLFGDDSNQATCSFIESIRFGTYDEEGQLATGWRFRSMDREVTENQKYLLAFSLFLCVSLGLYSCFLHHSITNLLIKSLSHTDLLPARSKHQHFSSNGSHRSNSSRRSRSRSRRRRRMAVTEDETDSDDWDTAKKPPPRRSSSRSSRNSRVRR